MQDGPSASELLEGVGSLLSELAETVPDEQRFGVLVATNACAMLGRELAGADAERAAEQERLSALLGRETEGAWDARARAAAAIRRGRFDDDLAAVAAVLRESVRAKLAVAHPGWDAVADDGRG